MNFPLPSSVLSPTLPVAATSFPGLKLLAWLLVGAGTLTLPISAITLLMLLARSYGTANATLGGTLLIVGGPLALIATGVGLLFRQPWAYAGVLVLAAAIVAVNVAALLRGPTPTRTFVDANGVKNTVTGSSVNAPLRFGAIAAAVGAAAALLRPRVREAFGNRRPLPPPLPASIPPPGVSSVLEHPIVAAAPARAWRVGHAGRDRMYYEERIDRSWERIVIDGEMLMGRAHHAIYFVSPEAWRGYPLWARHRREEIVARIKSEFRAPDYEYTDQGTAAVAAPAGKAAPTPTLASRPFPTATASQWRALALAVALMLGLAGGMGWLVLRGVSKGETFLPAKRASQSRTVRRATEPALFWVSVGTYGFVGAGALALGAWGLREAARHSAARRRAASSSA